MKKIILMFSILASLFSSFSVAFAADDTVDSSRTGDADVRSHRSSGGLFVEPMLIYSKNEASIKTSQLPLLTGDSSGTINDAAIGARLGFHVADIFILAADGRYGKSRFQDSLYSTADGSNYNYGVTAGVQTPLAGIQLFGTYILGGVFDPAAGANNIDMKFTDARGYRVGAGLHILAVSVNLDYQDLTYNNSTIESFGNFTVNQSSKVDATQRGYAVSLGFPIEL